MEFLHFIVLSIRRSLYNLALVRIIVNIITEHTAHRGTANFLLMLSIVHTGIAMVRTKL